MKQGQFKCKERSDCPAGWFCTEGFCYSEASTDGCDKSIPWWDEAWLSRDHIAIRNAGANIRKGYTVAYTFNHNAMVAAGSSLVGGNDIRVVYWDGVSSTELDRIIAPQSGWNSVTTTILFALADDILADESISKYAIYSNNPLAGSAPNNVSNIFSYEAGWAMQVEANPAQSLGCPKRSQQFYSVQLRQLNTTSWDYEIHVYDKTNDTTATGRLIITNNDALHLPTGVVFDQTFGDYGSFLEAGTHTVSPVFIQSTDFKVSIRTGENSKSRQYFGCQLFSYAGSGNGGNQTDNTVFNYRRPSPAVPTVSASLDCTEQ